MTDLSAKSEIVHYVSGCPFAHHYTLRTRLSITSGLLLAPRGAESFRDLLLTPIQFDLEPSILAWLYIDGRAAS